MKYITTVNDQKFTIEIDQESQLLVNGEPFEIDFSELTEGNLLSLLINNQSFEAIVEAGADHYEVLMRGELYTVEVLDEREYRLSQARGHKAAVTGEITIKSPMPGLILKTPVTDGMTVAKGQTVIILESMKMENELKSPRDGVVKRVHVSEGASVEKDQLLITIGDPEAAADGTAESDENDE